ncbi:MAG: hypothetical protein WC960_01330 [Bacteroidales bacterium]
MFKRENNAGIYLTVAVHLILLIILLINRIDFILKEESSFLLDFTKEEVEERELYLERVKEEAKEEIERLLSGTTPIRNVAVDLSRKEGERLKDDRNRDPSDIYDRARELQKKLDQAKKSAESGIEISKESRAKAKEEAPQSYRGPSVISYRIEGREAILLPVPAYKCLGGGDVVVEIKVDRAGYVKEAAVVQNKSSTDPCLHTYSLMAARNSRFSANSKDTPLKMGEITYRFIAQRGR